MMLSFKNLFLEKLFQQTGFTIANLLKPSSLHLWDSKTVNELIAAGFSVLSDYPDARFFGIGGSASYFIYTLDRLAQLMGKRTETGHIPFSGALVERTHRSSTFTVSSNTQEFKGFKEHIKAYHKYLDMLGFHPDAIIEAHKQSGKKTIIVDCANKGNGLASFTYIMRLWARELGIEPQFAQAFTCVALTRTLPYALQFQIPEARISFPIDRTLISINLEHTLISSKDHDRFVPAYYPQKWGSPPPTLSTQTLERATLIKNRLDESCLDFAGKPAPLKPVVVLHEATV